MLVAWPRIPYYRGEILTGLTVCWSRIEEQKIRPKELGILQQHLESTVNILTAVLARLVNVPEEYQVIIDSDKRFRRLLLV